MVFSCFAVYVMANNTRVPYFESCMVQKYGRVLFASTYTANQLKTMYYSHSYTVYCISLVF